MKQLPFIFIILFLGTASNLRLVAQEMPPIPISVSVNTAKNLNFGSFTVGASGGTISVSFDDQITNTSGVYPLNIGGRVSAALFDVTANPGTIISIQSPPQIPLRGSNGGEIILIIDSFSSGQTFVTTAYPPLTNEIRVGGTLHIPGNTQDISGKYNGVFTLNFIHQ